MIANYQGVSPPALPDFITVIRSYDLFTPERSSVVKPIVSYIRVSTGRQGKSGLGIEAQREAIARFAAAENMELAGEYVEIETGEGADALDRRPKLAAALAATRKLKSYVVVAKLDRL